MSEFVAVGRVSELKPGQMKRVMVDGQQVLLANVDGDFYAVRDECSHRGAALSKGKMEGHAVECPRHHARFDVRSGDALKGPSFGPLRLPGQIEGVSAYKVRVEGDTVLVQL
ncbi:MAG: non-heme iron oxygenase ferredoxin subunit [Chloroflexota bacterium]|nr:non-heme iron oxygenase ferredoxin subunit [Chloroflexota bacterium]